MIKCAVVQSMVVGVLCITLGLWVGIHWALSFFPCCSFFFFTFFFNDTATTEIYTLSLQRRSSDLAKHFYEQGKADATKESIKNAKNVDMTPRQSHGKVEAGGLKFKVLGEDRKSTRLTVTQ